MKKNFFSLTVFFLCALFPLYAESTDLVCIRLLSGGEARNWLLRPAGVMIDEIKRWEMSVSIALPPEESRTEKAGPFRSSIILPFLFREKETACGGLLKLNLLGADFKKMRFYGVASGLISDDEESLCGLQTAFLDHADQLDGVQTALLYAASDSIRGVQCALQSFALSAHGVQLAVTGTFAEKLAGVQCAGIGNVSSGKLCGIQLAGLVNAAENVTGIQASLLGNISRKSFSGLQIGLLNYADRGNGVQIGLLNRIDGAWIRYFPLIHVSFGSEKK